MDEDSDDHLSLPSSTTAFSTQQLKQITTMQEELAELRAQMALLQKERAESQLSKAFSVSHLVHAPVLPPPPPGPPPLNLYKKNDKPFAINKTTQNDEKINENKTSFLDVLKDINNVKLKKIPKK